MGYYTKKARLNIRKSIALCEDLLYEIDRCICRTDRYLSSSFFIATDKIFDRINEFIFNRNIQIKKSKMCMKNGTTHTHTHVRQIIVIYSFFILSSLSQMHSIPEMKIINYHLIRSKSRQLDNWLGISNALQTSLIADYIAR